MRLGLISLDKRNQPYYRVDHTVSIKNNPLTKSAVEYSIWSTKPNKISNNIFNSSIVFCGRKTKKRTLPYIKIQNDLDSESTTNFLIKDLPGLHCPACGKPLINSSLYDIFLDRLYNSSESQYISILEDYEKHLQPMEKKIFQEIKDTVGNNPNKPLRAILKMLRNENLPILQKQQLKILDEMKEYVTTSRDLKKEDKAKIYNIMYTNKSKILQTNESSFQRKMLISSIQESGISNNKAKRDLLKISYKLPGSTNSISSWIVKYSGKDKSGKPYSSKDIAIALLDTAKTNVDHMLAKNVVMKGVINGESGKNEISNYLPMHTGCNSAKSNITFIEWYNQSPQDRESYLTEYFIEVQKAINKGKIKDARYKNYVDNAINKIKRITNGVVKIDIEYIKQKASQ